MRSPPSGRSIMIARSTSASVLSAQGIAAVIGGKPERYQSGGTSTAVPINQEPYSNCSPTVR